MSPPLPEKLVRSRNVRAVFAAIATMALIACSHSEARERAPNGVPLAPNVHCASPDCRSGVYVSPYVRTRSKYGIGCMGDTPPGQRVNPELPPQSYLAADIGKPGFPKLRQRELQTVRSIQHDGHWKSLRIAWLGYATTPHNFIVFDATDGPCEVAAGGYAVLNGDCNELYQPGENPYSTHAGTGCYPESRPWISPTPTRP